MSSRLSRCLLISIIFFVAVIGFSLWQNTESLYDRLNGDKSPKSSFDGVTSMVMFIGYPRSGHTLVGSLMDAHPHVIVANEYDLISKWDHWGPEEKQRKNVFYKLYNSSYWEVNTGYRAPNKAKGLFRYHVPNQWQGTFKGHIQVIGDKKGGRTTRHLGKNGKDSVLNDIQETLGIPIKLIHVVRNPFDTISTMVLRQLNLRKQVHILSKKVNNERNLRERAASFIRLASTNDELRNSLRSRIFDLHSEKLIANPHDTLKKLCDFLEIECSESYIKDCSSIIYKEESHTRDFMVWPPDLIDEVHENVQHYDFLREYTFTS